MQNDDFQRLETALEGTDELRAWFCALTFVFDALRGFLDRCLLELVRTQGASPHPGLSYV